MREQIIFFDGECGFCSASIRFLRSIDHKGHISFAPLQGITAQELLPESLRTDLNTLVYRTAGENHLRSEAFIRVLMDIGGIWRIAWILRLIPRSMRDWCYTYIAHRRQWISTLLGQSCELPSDEERKRFLP